MHLGEASSNCGSIKIQFVKQPIVVVVVLGFNATLTAKVISVGDAHAFPGFLTPVSIPLSKATDYFSQMVLQR